MSTTTEHDVEPELLLDLPPGFTGLPLRGSEEDNAASIDALAAELAPHAGEHAAAMPEYVNWFAHLLADNKVRLYGRFVVSDESVAGPVPADLVLAVAALEAADDDAPAALRRNPDIAAARLRQQYVERHPHADARVVRLAMNTAMVAVTAGEYRLPRDATRTGQETVLPQIRCEFQIPTPDGAHLVMMAVSTTSESGCQAVLTEAMRIANTIRVEDPEPSEGNEAE